MTVTIRGVNGGIGRPRLGIDREHVGTLLSREIRLEPERLADATAIRPQGPRDRLRDDRDRMIVDVPRP